MRRNRAAAAALFCAAAFVSSLGIGEAWLYGHQGFSGALRSTIASNYKKYGFINTKFRPLKQASGLRPGERPPAHWHHPPLVNAAVAVSFSLLGESEAAARLVPAACTLLALLLTYLMLARSAGEGAALCAVFLALLAPMFAQYGKIVNYEPPTLLLGTAAVFAHLEIRRGGGLGWFAAELAALGAGTLSDWPIFLLAAVLGFHGLLCLGKRPAVRVAYFAGVGVFSAMCMLAVWTWLGSMQGKAGGLEELARWRGWAGAGTSLAGFIGQSGRRLYIFFTPLVLALSAGWLVSFIARLVRGRTGPQDHLPAIFLAWGLLYVAIFRQAASIHVFNFMYLLPFFAASAALCARAAWEKLRPGSGVFKAGILSLFFAAAIAQALPLNVEAHYLSYGLYPGKARDVWFEIGLLGKFLARVNSGLQPVYAVEPFDASPQFKYYCRCEPRKSRALPAALSEAEAKSGIVVARIDRIGRAEAEAALAAHRAYRFGRWLVVDASSTNPSFEAFDVKLGRAPLLHRLFVSFIYPEYSVVRP